MNMLQKTNDANTLIGASFAIAGIVKGLGIKTLDENQIIDTLNTIYTEKNAKPNRKVAVLN
jgi:hypothetical protein